MLRITELKLPLDHAADALRPAICARLGIADSDLLVRQISGLYRVKSPHLVGLHREALEAQFDALRAALHRALEAVRGAGDFQFAFVLDDCDKLIQTAPPALLRRLLQQSANR